MTIKRIKLILYTPASSLSFPIFTFYFNSSKNITCTHFVFYISFCNSLSPCHIYYNIPLYKRINDTLSKKKRLLSFQNLDPSCQGPDSQLGTGWECFYSMYGTFHKAHFERRNTNFCRTGTILVLCRTGEGLADIWGLMKDFRASWEDEVARRRADQHRYHTQATFRHSNNIDQHCLFFPWSD